MQRNDRKAPQTGSDTINALIATRSALAAPPVVIAPKNGIVELDLDQLDDNPDQPRQWMDPDAVEDIAASIFKRGTRQPDQPITVRSGGESGRYFIVMGHCRKAAKRWRSTRWDTRRSRSGRSTSSRKDTRPASRSRSRRSTPGAEIVTSPSSRSG